MTAMAQTLVMSEFMNGMAPHGIKLGNDIDGESATIIHAFC